MPPFINQIFIVVTILASIGLIYIVYSRGGEKTVNRLFILILVLVIGYIISHGIHFMMISDADVTTLDQSCHSLLLLILVVLTLFTYHFPSEHKMNLLLKVVIILPSLLFLFAIWMGWLVEESHVHGQKFEAHYSEYYPLFLFWYMFLLILNAYWLTRKILSEKDYKIKRQLQLLFIGVIITNFTAFLVGLYFPWILGIYNLVEISPLAFLVGVIAFTAIAVGKYNMFPAALDKLHSFSITKKTVFSAIIIVPIIIITVQIPAIRILFNFDSAADWQKFFLVSLFGGLIVSVSMAFVIVKVIANPLINLRSKAQEIKKGNYGIVVDITSNDEIGELVETFNDMSKTLERDSIELKIKEKRISMLFNAFEKSIAAIAIVDREGSIVDVNYKFTNLVGKTKPEIINNNIQQIQFYGALSEDYKEILNILKTNKMYEGEISIETDGQERVLLLTITPIGDGKEDEGYLFVEVDITEIKKLESKLAESEKLAALGKMAAILAHEIKTPLTSIKMNSDILYETLDVNESEKQSFIIIQKEINRLNNLVKEVLNFSKKIEIVKTEFNLSDLLDELILNTKQAFENENFNIINEINDTMIYADKEKLYQVLLNFVNNAHESSGADGEMRISCDTYPDGTSIFISDNGKGIDKDIISKIFEPFYTSKASGTGLGLAIARRIIEEHGGDITLESSKPGSTSFKISIPQNS